MKILYLTQFFSTTQGGGEVVFHNFAEGMVKKGHEVSVICLRIKGARDDTLPGVKVYRISPAMKFQGGLPPSIKQNLLYIINAVIQGSRIIRKNQIDVIHTNNFSPVIAGTVLGKLYGIPVISTIHDVFSTSSNDYWKTWARQNNVSKVSEMIGPLFEKLTIKAPVTAIHTVSNSTRDDLRQFGSKAKTVVIPNGIDLHHYISNGSNEYQQYIVFVGRLVFYKNLEVVIKAFKEVVAKLPTAKLLVVGDGPMRDKWEKLALDCGLENNVVFKGYVSHEMKLHLIRNSSALVLPSLFEGFGLVLLEAFAFAKPVLVADVRPYDEIVDDSVDGFIIGANDVSQWASKILALLSDPNTSKLMGIKGQQKVHDKYEIPRVIDGLEKLYTDVAIA